MILAEPSCPVSRSPHRISPADFRKGGESHGDDDLVNGTQYLVNVSVFVVSVCVFYYAVYVVKKQTEKYEKLLII